MKITGTSKSDNIKRSKAPKSASSVADDSFSRLVENSTTAANIAPSNNISVSRIDFNVAIPGILEENSPKYLAYKHGEDILEQLESLRLDILSGTISIDRLKTIATKMENYGTDVQDEKLKAIIDEIHLRAEVEIAKYMRDN